MVIKNITQLFFSFVMALFVWFIMIAMENAWHKYDPATYVMLFTYCTMLGTFIFFVWIKAINFVCGFNWPVNLIKKQEG